MAKKNQADRGTYLLCALTVNTFVQLSCEDGLEEGRRDSHAADLANPTEQLTKPSSDGQGVLCDTVNHWFLNYATARAIYGVYAPEGRLRKYETSICGMFQRLQDYALNMVCRTTALPKPRGICT